MKRVEIIAVGSEMLTPFRADTNSLYLTRTLEEYGYAVTAKTIIGDDLQGIADTFDHAFARADVVIATGGLGPTVDDLTRDALAAFLKVPLRLDQEVMDRIAARFAKRGIRMPEVNRKQAMIPEGGVVLPNHNGTAPGIYLKAHGKDIFLLPGPPFELEPMWERYGLPLLPRESSLLRKSFRVAMLPESQVDEMLAPVHKHLKSVQYTILAAPAQIEIHLTTPESSLQELEMAAAQVREILGTSIYSEQQQALEEIVGDLLKKRGKTVAVAESCTGGSLAQRFTNVPGSSVYFERGVVTYSNRSKTELLQVPAALIAEHGAVSEPVAAAMAEAVRRLAGVDYALSVTGIAGPDGGTADKPVGVVFIGLAFDGGCNVKRYHFPGNRERIRYASTQAALNMLRLKLIE
jgi:nicotinamide-nucleotide amidase